MLKAPFISFFWQKFRERRIFTTEMISLILVFHTMWIVDCGTQFANYGNLPSQFYDESYFFAFKIFLKSWFPEKTINEREFFVFPIKFNARFCCGNNNNFRFASEIFFLFSFFFVGPFRFCFESIMRILLQFHEKKKLLLFCKIICFTKLQTFFFVKSISFAMKSRYISWRITKTCI